MSDRPMDDIVDFWFSDACKPNWFTGGGAFDQLVRDRLSPFHHRAAAGEFDHWAADVDGALALCVLLDQVPRNCFRGSALAFATDAKALQVTKHAIHEGFDHDCAEEERMFLYLPLMHDEDMDSQKRSVQLFQERCSIAEAVAAAIRHHDVIARFGRFPYRNEALGRESTAAELEFLREFQAP